MNEIIERLNGTVLVTGASSGIGRALCNRLLEAGNKVVGIARYRKQPPIEHELFTPVTVDLSNLDILPNVLQGVAGQFPDIENVVFCAGTGRFGSLEEFSYQQIQELLNVNFTSVAYITKVFIPAMKKRKRGHLIYIGSESAVRGGGKGAVYCASKFAVRGMAQSLREECSKSHIRVSLINPGMVKTPFFDELSFEPGDNEDNYLSSDTVAQTLMYVLQSPAATCFDEVNLTPLKHVVQSKAKND